MTDRASSAQALVMMRSNRQQRLPHRVVRACALPLISLAWVACDKPPTLTESTPTEPTAYSAAVASSVPPKPSATAPDVSDVYPLSEDEIRAIVNPGNQSEYTGPTGVVEGTITVTGDPPEVTTYPKIPPTCAHGAEVHGATYRKGPKGELEGALVAVIGYSGYVRTPRNDRNITIRNCAIEPPVIDLTLGQRLMVTNDDDVPYMPQVAAKMVVRRIALKGMTPVPVMLTHIAPYALSWLLNESPSPDVPTATVFVLPSPLHVVTTLDGKYRITGIPVGKAKLTVAHLGMNEVMQDLDVKAGEVAKVDIKMTFKGKGAPAAASGSGSAKKPPAIK